jgi:hypothetical protein
MATLWIGYGLLCSFVGSLALGSSLIDDEQMQMRTDQYIPNSVAHYKDRLLTERSDLVNTVARRCNSTLDNSDECLLAGTCGFFFSYWRGFPH